MARSVAQIQESITTIYVANMAAIGYAVDPDTWSKTNLQRLFIYVVAFCTSTLETLLDLHVIEINEKIAAQYNYTLRWHADHVKEFQDGFALLPDSDQYDNTGATDAEIEASKIVHYAAVIEQSDMYGRISLRFKLATTVGDDLGALANDKVLAIAEYIRRTTPAGIKRIVGSYNPDSTKQKWRIFYDPLVLTNTGARIDGASATPVQDAIKDYLKNLPFNGIYVPQYHVDEVQKVPGVVIGLLDEVSARYGLLDFTPVDEKYIPDAGYLRFEDDADLVCEFIAQNPIQ